MTGRTAEAGRTDAGARSRPGADASRPSPGSGGRPRAAACRTGTSSGPAGAEAAERGREARERAGAACATAALALVSLAPLLVRGGASSDSAAWHYTGRAFQVLTCLGVMAAAWGRACPRPWALQLAGAALCLGACALDGFASPLGACLNGSGAACALVGCLLWLPCLDRRRAAPAAPLALALAHALFLGSLALPALEARAARAACYAGAAAFALASMRLLGPAFLSWSQGAPGSGRAPASRGAGARPMLAAEDAPLVAMGATVFPFFYGQLAQLSHPSTGLFDPVSEAVAVAALLAYAVACMRLRAAVRLHELLLALVALFATGYLLFPLASGGASAPAGWMVKAGFLACSCAVWSWAADRGRSRPELAASLFAAVEACLHAAILLGRALVAGLVGAGWSQGAIADRLVPAAIWALAMLLLAMLLGAQRKAARTRENTAPGPGARGSDSGGPGAGGPPGAHAADPLGSSCSRLASERGLTAREAEVLREFARGRSSSYIAGSLGLSQQTVKTHLKHIYQKVGVHDKQDLLDLIDLLDGAEGGDGEGKSG